MTTQIYGETLEITNDIPEIKDCCRQCFKCVRCHKRDGIMIYSNAGDEERGELDYSSILCSDCMILIIKQFESDPKIRLCNVPVPVPVPVLNREAVKEKLKELNITYDNIVRDITGLKSLRNDISEQMSVLNGLQ
jgi:hypothetical protein